MRICGAICLLLFIAGCSHSAKQSKSGPARLSPYATTQLSIPPEQPNPQPTADAVQGATGEAQAAQSDVRQVIAMAQSNPAAQGAMAALSSADLHLTNVIARLNDASGQLVRIMQQISDNAKTYQQREDKLKADQSKIAKLATSQTTELQAQIDELKNEQLRKMQFILYAIGTILCLGSIGMFALRLYTGFAMGSTLGAFAMPTGFAALGFAKLLPKLSEYAGWGVIGGAVVFVLYGAFALWHALQHTPAVPNGATGVKQ